MTFQTKDKDASNRYKNSPEGLKLRICSKWLPLVDVLRTCSSMVGLAGVNEARTCLLSSQSWPALA
jgi:hypothetical protein